VHDAQQQPPFWAPNDIFRYTTEELLGITTQYATSKEACERIPVQGSREAVPDSNKAMPYNAAVQNSKKDAKGGKKRRKRCPQGVTTVADNDNNNDMKVDDIDMKCITTAVRNCKRQARPSIDHFERLLEEACPNREYPVKHKHKDCDMIKNFMTLGSLTRDKEPEEDPDGSNAMSFPGKM
jgi:hypothetical protein